MRPKLYVGMPVHYVSQGSPVLPDGTQRYRSVCRAATITELDHGDQIGLVALNPTGLFFHPLSDGGCHYDEDGHAPGTWHRLDDC